MTSLSKIPIDTVVELAHQSRDRWISGEISRYDVVEYFVDKLISNVEGEYDTNLSEVVEKNAAIGARSIECATRGMIHRKWSNRVANTTQEIDNSTIQCLLFNSRMYNLQHTLPRIHVITSAWDKKYGLSEHTRTPSSIQQLRRMLIQTTWM